MTFYLSNALQKTRGFKTKCPFLKIFESLFIKASKSENFYRQYYCASDAFFKGRLGNKLDFRNDAVNVQSAYA